MKPRQLTSELSFDFLIKKEGLGRFIAEELKQAEFMVDLIIKFCGKKRQ